MFALTLSGGYSAQSHIQTDLHTQTHTDSLQVQQAHLEPGEERVLRDELRRLDARRASVERAGLFHQAVTGTAPPRHALMHSNDG